MFSVVVWAIVNVHIFGESLSKDIVLVSRKFNKALRRLDRKWRTNVQDKVSDIGPHCMSKDENKPNRDKGAYSYEYEGFGHINIEFPTFLKK